MNEFDNGFFRLSVFGHFSLSRSGDFLLALTRHDLENDFIKTISSKAKFIESITADPKLKNRINNLYYSIHSSPTRTSSEVVVYETKITELLEDLETVVGRDSIAATEKIVEIEYMLNKRNFMIKARR